MKPDLQAIIAGLVVGIGGWFALFSWSIGNPEPASTYFPWAIWQMVVFAVIAAAGAVYFTLAHRFAISTTYAFATTISFVALFILAVRSTDVTGLFMVGAFMIVVGLMTLLITVAGITALVSWAAHRNHASNAG
ncbi:hypothetical protein [Corynebacterium aquilae]|uniref:Uncharacterized protein n=1 Tax=Corynebacterium aquilae DSM 44791 TaxID=1431546 RepID=A0A1L7CFJ6_9CORY|nr:hypothetical protein [Corynebacterium aquilae]APT84605.1 hypothetical protein CAQU_05460 [Corynebacterium aquilae DSM 44791]